MSVGVVHRILCVSCGIRAVEKVDLIHNKFLANIQKEYPRFQRRVHQRSRVTLCMNEVLMKVNQDVQGFHWRKAGTRLLQDLRINSHPISLRRDHQFHRAKSMPLRVRKVDACQIGGVLFSESSCVQFRVSNSGSISPKLKKTYLAFIRSYPSHSPSHSNSLHS